MPRKQMGDAMSKKKQANTEPVELERFVSQEKMRNKTENTYEAVMISAREARRINLHLRMVGDEVDRSIKVTSEAMKRLLDNDVLFDYKNLPEEDE